MKKILFVAIGLLFLFASHAQTVTPVFFKTSAAKLYNYAYEGSLRTTDSTTYHTIGTIAIAANEVGNLEVEVVGIDTTTTGGYCTGKKIVQYVKKAGTLTLATPTAVLATTTSIGMTTSTWDITTSSNQIIIRVRGTLSREILWTVRVRQLKKVKPA
jgi:hypothetical protein